YARFLDDQRVVTRGFERIRQTGEDTLARVMDHRGLAVHDLARAHDTRAERLTDALVAEADAEYRDLAAELPHECERDARLIRGAGAGRDDDARGRSLADFLDRECVVAHDLDVFAELAQVLDEVVGEAVVVVDHENHGAHPGPTPRHCTRANAVSAKPRKIFTRPEARKK